MAQTIKLKRSAVAGRIPSTSDLELGEVAINTYDGKMYIKKTVNGVDSIVEIGANGFSGTAFTQYTYTATANQSVFTGADNSGSTLDVVDEFSNVFMNGVLLDPDVDFTVSSDGLTLTLTTPAAAGDIIQINSFDQAVFNGTLDVDQLIASGITYPTTDGTNRQVIMTDGSGTLSFENLDTIHTACVNQTGSTLLKGTPVYQTGTSGNSIIVAPADASSASTMPAVGVLEQDLADQAEGFIIHLGQISGVDTSTFSEGDTIYVAVGGGFTNVPPTGEGNLLQNLGQVTKVHATNGGGVVMGAGRSNATPNLNNGNIFIGNASNQAVTNSFYNVLENTTGYNNSNWDTAYTYSQVGHLPLSGGTLTGDLNFSAQANRAIKIDTTVADNETRDAIELFEDDEKATGRQAISWWNDNQGYYKARLWTEVGGGYNNTKFGIDVADNARTVATRITIENGDTCIHGNLKIGSTTVIDSSRNLTNIGSITTNASTSDMFWLERNDTSGITSTIRNNTGGNTLRLYGDYANNDSLCELQLQAGQNGDYAQVGTWTNNPLYLKTNNTNKLAIETNGDLRLMVGGLKVGSSTVIDSARAASFTSVGVTNIVTNKIVKFNGSILDDSIISDDGTNATVAGSLTVQGSVEDNRNRIRSSASLNDGSYQYLCSTLSSYNGDSSSADFSIYVTDRRKSVKGTIVVRNAGGVSQPSVNIHHSTVENLVIVGQWRSGSDDIIDFYVKASGASFAYTPRFAVSNLVRGSFETSPPAVTSEDFSFSCDSVTAQNIISNKNITLGAGYNISWGGQYAEGKPTIASTSNSIHFYPVGNILGEKVRINSEGKIGVNVSNPQGRIGVVGASGYTLGNSGKALEGIDVTAVAGGSGNRGGAISLGVGGTGRASICAVQGSGDSDNTEIAFNVHGSTGGHDAIEVVRIGSDQTVGIGASTTSGAKLMVDNSASGHAYLGIKGSAIDTAQLWFGDPDDANRGSITYNNSTDSLHFKTNGILDRLSIDQNGNVGVRTGTPSYQLQVKNVSGSSGFAVTRADNENAPLLQIQTDSTKSFIRTNGDLLLSTTTTGNTSYAERVRIKEDTGNVGIGTSSVRQKLTVNGIVEAGDASTVGGGIGLLIPYTSDDYTAVYGSKYSSGGVLIGYGLRSSTTTPSAYTSMYDNFSGRKTALTIDNDFRFLASASGTHTVGDQVTVNEVFTIEGGGAVGIGVPNPSSRLEIGSAYDESIVLHDTRTSTTATFYHGIRFRHYNNYDNGLYFEHNDYFGTGRDAFLVKVGSSEKFRIKHNGNTGIGTTNPEEKLHVDGAVKVTGATKSSTINGGLVHDGPAYKEYQFYWSGQQSHTVTMTCGSYFMAEVIYTAHQTNSGVDNNEYRRGKWSNNHDTHIWEEFENSGNIDAMNTTFTVSQNDVFNSGKLVIQETYPSQGPSYARSTLTLRVYYNDFTITKS